MPLSAFNILIILHCSEQSVQRFDLNLRLYYPSSDSLSLVSKQETLVGESLAGGLLLTFSEHYLISHLPQHRVSFQTLVKSLSSICLWSAGPYSNYLASLAITGLVRSRYTDMQLEIRCPSLLLADTVDFSRILLEFSTLSFGRQTS